MALAIFLADRDRARNHVPSPTSNASGSWCGGAGGPCSSYFSRDSKSLLSKDGQFIWSSWVVVLCRLQVSAWWCPLNKHDLFGGYDMSVCWNLRIQGILSPEGFLKDKDLEPEVGKWQPKLTNAVFACFFFGDLDGRSFVVAVVVVGFNDCCNIPRNCSFASSAMATSRIHDQISDFQIQQIDPTESHPTAFRMSKSWKVQWYLSISLS